MPKRYATDPKIIYISGKESGIEWEVVSEKEKDRNSEVFILLLLVEKFSDYIKYLFFNE